MKGTVQLYVWQSMEIFVQFSDSLKHVDTATYPNFYVTPPGRDSRAAQSRPGAN